MLVEVGGADGEERLVAGVGVAVVLADGVAGRRLGDPAGPLGDGAVGVAGAFSAERGQVRSEARDLVGGEPGGGGSGEDAPEDERGAERGAVVALVTFMTFMASDPQNEYLTEAEMKSRSASSLPSPAYRV